MGEPFLLLFGEDRIGGELMAVLFEHLNQPVETLHHLFAAVVTYDEGHLEFRVLFQIVKFPRVKIGDEITIVAYDPAYHPVVEPLWQIV